MLPRAEQVVDTKPLEPILSPTNFTSTSRLVSQQTFCEENETIQPPLPARTSLGKSSSGWHPTWRGVAQSDAAGGVEGIREGIMDGKITIERRRFREKILIALWPRWCILVP